MLFRVKSRRGISIRLTDERWLHVVEEHSELAGMLETVLDAIENADVVYAGNTGENLAAKRIEEGKYLVVVYREIDEMDGFLITAFLTRRVEYLQRRSRLWP